MLEHRRGVGGCSFVCRLTCKARLVLITRLLAATCANLELFYTQNHVMRDVCLLHHTFPMFVLITY